MESNGSKKVPKLSRKVYFQRVREDLFDGLLEIVLAPLELQPNASPVLVEIFH